MGLFTKSKENPLVSPAKDLGRLNCEECGTIAEEMFLTDDSMLCCNECVEAVLRKQRFEKEEAEFNNIN